MFRLSFARGKEEVGFGGRCGWETVEDQNQGQTFQGNLDGLLSHCGRVSMWRQRASAE